MTTDILPSRNLCDHECDCSCHNSPDSSVHVIACCTPCQLCNRDIKRDLLELHQKTCHPKSKAELFAELLAALADMFDKTEQEIGATLETAVTKLLAQVDPKYHKACKAMIEYFEADKNFLSYLEQDENCQKAVNEAFNTIADGCETVANLFKETAKRLKAMDASNT